MKWICKGNLMRGGGEREEEGHQPRVDALRKREKSRIFKQSDVNQVDVVLGERNVHTISLLSLRLPKHSLERRKFRERERAILIMNK